MTVSTDQNFFRRWLQGLSWGNSPMTQAGLAAEGPQAINLALQGGGAHGAFTWGVLDALLEYPRFTLEGISGSSAGAMNAVLVADGWLKGGREGARKSLDDFWTAIGRQLPFALMAQHQDDQVVLSPLGKLVHGWTGVFSPSQVNPFDLNPLRDILASQVDFGQLRQHSPFKLFVCATQVSTGRGRIFRESELTVDVMLASACLPRIHHPIQIDGEAYWDGGFSANPPVAPLFYECDSPDILLVLLNPLVRQGVPGTVAEIEARTAELAFTASFMTEMRMLLRAIGGGTAARAAHGLRPSPPRLPPSRFHMIDTSHHAAFQRSDTKLLACGPFLGWLRDLGRGHAEAWLQGPAKAVGSRSSIDLHALFA